MKKKRWKDGRDKNEPRIFEGGLGKRYFFLFAILIKTWISIGLILINVQYKWTQKKSFRTNSLGHLLRKISKICFLKPNIVKLIPLCMCYCFFFCCLQAKHECIKKLWCYFRFEKLYFLYLSFWFNETQNGCLFIE